MGSKQHGFKDLFVVDLGDLPNGFQTLDSGANALY